MGSFSFLVNQPFNIYLNVLLKYY